MWKLKYMAPKGYRTNKGFWGVSLLNSFIWYCYEQDKWVNWNEVGSQGSSTHHLKPKTKKAFIRYLKKHPELKGQKVALVHREFVVEGDGKFVCALHIEANWED